ncbi:hypothetical protein [Novosphingobium sp. KACC 22771]|nr:hypothetical protein [Novosphingobium sp. KACC 22771]WDF74813.1 hypothetical protein PQ467_17470 [Novosphingobium sp. KACC 22771]
MAIDVGVVLLDPAGKARSLPICVAGRYKPTPGPTRSTATRPLRPT